MPKMRRADYGMENRWTPKLAQGGFTPVPQVLLKHYTDLNITSMEAMLVVHLLSYKWDEQLPFPSMTTLAGRMGCSPRYVRKLCESLESVGYLKRNGRIGMSNQFDLSGLFARLEPFLDSARSGAVVSLEVRADGGLL